MARSHRVPRYAASKFEEANLRAMAALEEPVSTFSPMQVRPEPRNEPRNQRKKEPCLAEPVSFSLLLSGFGVDRIDGVK